MQPLELLFINKNELFLNFCHNHDISYKKLNIKIIFRILSSVEVYDESYNIWKECESLPYPVFGAAAFSLDDSIHIFGGITYKEDNEKISVNTAIFDTKKNR